MKTKLILLLLAIISLAPGAVQTGGAAEAQAKLRYAGTVVDASGQPVPGATVELFQFDQGLMINNPEQLKPAQTATSGTNGAFEFRAPGRPSFILASKAGLAPAWCSSWNATTELDEQLVLTPPGTIQGLLVDESDKPIAGARVWLTTAYSIGTVDNNRATHYLPSMPRPDRFSARTGADGKFQIPGCPTNAAFDLALELPGKVLRAMERQYVSPDTMRWRPGQKELKLVAESAGTVEGKVLSEKTGEALAGATITLQSNSRSGGVPELKSGVSKADGTFKITEVPPGAYSLNTRFGTNQARALVAETVKITVTAGQATRGIEVAAITPGMLAARVVSKEDQKGIAGVNVNASSPNFNAGALTDEKGTALMTLAPGEYHVAAYWQNARAEQNSITVEAGATNQVQLEMESPQRVSGVVLDPDGKPAAGLQVRVMPEWRMNIGIVKTDEQGRFSFARSGINSGGPNEACCVVVRDIQRNLAVAEDLPEGLATLELKLKPALSFSGRIEDMQGHPLSNGTVTVFFWTANSGFSFDNKPIRADQDGKFSVGALPAGRRYSASATARGHGSQSQELHSEDAETNRIKLEPFTLNVADRKLAGQVVDAEDKPVSGAWVSLNGQGQPNGSTRSDEKGFFKFDEVCEGPVQLFANAQSSFANVRTEGGETNVLLKLGQNSGGYTEAPRRPSLQGKPLPELTGFGLATDCAPTGKPVLVCLVDIDQRPSRKFLRDMAQRHDTLRQGGLNIIVLQAAACTPEALKEWKDANTVPFTLGQADKDAKWACTVESFPWLILTDKEHKVASEGFGFEDLDGKLKDIGVGSPANPTNLRIK